MTSRRHYRKAASHQAHTIMFSSWVRGYCCRGDCDLTTARHLSNIALQYCCSQLQSSPGLPTALRRCPSRTHPKGPSPSPLSPSHLFSFSVFLALLLSLSLPPSVCVSRFTSYVCCGVVCCATSAAHDMLRTLCDCAACPYPLSC